MKIIFFDGYCTVCNVLVDWIIRIDKTGELKFASLQGETAAKMIGKSENSGIFDTVIYLRNNDKFDQSTAVLRILIDSGGMGRFAVIFLIVPKFFRDFIYRVVAKYRYRFIKRRETCRIPTKQEQGRLLQ